MPYGTIQLIIGPMFAGKSTELFRNVRRSLAAKKKVLVIQPISSIASEEISSDHTHLLTVQHAESGPLFSFAKSSVEYQVVAIDEAHFFTDVAVFAEFLANRGVTVFVSALDSTDHREPFSNVLALVPLAEGVRKLSAICAHCSCEAAFTIREAGSGAYAALCRQCFHAADQEKNTPAHEA